MAAIVSGVAYFIGYVGATIVLFVRFAAKLWWLVLILLVASLGLSFGFRTGPLWCRINTCPGAVLFRSDLSKPLTGWSTRNGTWSLQPGGLTSSDASWTWLELPFHTGRGNYTVKADIQILFHGSDAAFGILMGAGGSEQSDYSGGVAWKTSPSSASELKIWNPSFEMASSEFDPGSHEHTYIMESKNGVLTISVDGSIAVTGQEDNFSVIGGVAIWSSNAEIQLSSIEIVAA